MSLVFDLHERNCALPCFKDLKGKGVLHGSWGEIKKNGSTFSAASPGILGRAFPSYLVPIYSPSSRSPQQTKMGVGEGGKLLGFNACGIWKGEAAHGTAKAALRLVSDAGKQDSPGKKGICRCRCFSFFLQYGGSCLKMHTVAYIMLYNCLPVDF